MEWKSIGMPQTTKIEIAKEITWFGLRWGKLKQENEYI